MAVRQGKILVIDDNEDILFTLKMLLRPLAESVTTCTNPKEINRLVSTTKYNVILLDMNFTADAVSGKEGFYWLERIREISPETVVILITAYSDTEKAVRAIKAGATDFIPKPWQNEKMLATISSALELSLRRGEVQTLKEQKSVLTTTEPELEVIGESPAMEKIFKTVEKLKNADANILLQGENGTGKDLNNRHATRRLSCLLTWEASRTTCLKANYSVTKKGLLRMQIKVSRDVSRSHPAARSF